MCSWVRVVKSIYIRDLVIGIILHAFKIFLLVAALDKKKFKYTTARASTSLRPFCQA